VQILKAKLPDWISPEDKKTSEHILSPQQTKCRLLPQSTVTVHWENHPE
jgi:hypothetical protein